MSGTVQVLKFEELANADTLPARFVPATFADRLAAQLLLEKMASFGSTCLPEDREAIAMFSARLPSERRAREAAWSSVRHEAYALVVLVGGLGVRVDDQSVSRLLCHVATMRTAALKPALTPAALSKGAVARRVHAQLSELVDRYRALRASLIEGAGGPTTGVDHA